MLSDLYLRLRALLNRSAVEHGIEEELRFHVERQAEAYAALGLDRNEARRRALVEFGGLDQVKEECRDALGVRLVDTLWRDFRYAVRTVRRSPGFAATAIISIALAVGPNTLLFSIVNSLLLKPLPINDPDRVVFIQRVGSFVSHSFPLYRDLRDRNATFDGLAGYRMTMMAVDTHGRPTYDWGYLATGNYFDLLGVTPAMGRFFHQADAVAPGGSPYAVLSYDYWRTRFGGQPSAIGSTILINRIPLTVLGVAPRGFFGSEVLYRPKIWVPMMMQAQIEVGNPWLENRNTANTWVIGRLKPGVSIRQAEANLNAVLQQLAREYPSSDRGAAVTLTRPGLFGDTVGGPARAFAVGVMLLGCLVLLTACANLANTVVARGADRRREIAIRLAIGAGRGRIVRQALTETIVLAMAGGAAGAFATMIASTAISGWQLPVGVPLQLDLSPDIRVFIFAFLVSTVAGIALGVAPALHAAGIDPNVALKSVDGLRRRQWPIRDVFVGVQVTVCFVLLTACLTSLRSLQSTLTMPLGIERSGVTIAGLDLALAGYSQESGEALRRGALEAISVLPGVRSAAYGNSLPLNIDQSSTRIYADNWIASQSSAEVPRAFKYQVSPGFFRTLGIRMLQGRDFDWRDSSNSRRVAVINETFARQILRARDVVGRYFRVGPQGLPIEVIGVVETGKYQSLTEDDSAAMFEPILQSYNPTTVMIVHSSRPPSEVARDVRRVVSSLDPLLPLFGVRSIEEMLGFVLLPMRVAAGALGAFGLIAVMLAATGIHGVISYAVERRRRAVAIRLALGAPSRRVLALVLGGVWRAVILGVLLGVPLSIGVRGVLRNIVYERIVNDSGTLFAVALVVIVVALLASWPSARRIRALAPATALYPS